MTSTVLVMDPRSVPRPLHVSCTSPVDEQRPASRMSTASVHACLPELAPKHSLTSSRRLPDAMERHENETTSKMALDAMLSLESPNLPVAC